MCQSSVVVHSMGNECHLMLKDKTTISIRSQYDLISSAKGPPKVRARTAQTLKLAPLLINSRIVAARGGGGALKCVRLQRSVIARGDTAQIELRTALRTARASPGGDKMRIQINVRRACAYLRTTHSTGARVTRLVPTIPQLRDYSLRHVIFYGENCIHAVFHSRRYPHPSQPTGHSSQLPAAAGCSFLILAHRIDMKINIGGEFGKLSFPAGTPRPVSNYVPQIKTYSKLFPVSGCPVYKFGITSRTPFQQQPIVRAVHAVRAALGVRGAFYADFRKRSPAPLPRAVRQRGIVNSN
ncbi:hypothetical protein EVAR_6708_1 [Eumeta japonica]|uniref:Uncharacterized protein n=1 Tax=Eumeta variegata TaxID=151549 RepID=A0A4C1TNA4_EUMVA|nr:hypothetical protein EVAR_6708_1 [Eumeta japonica]